MKKEGYDDVPPVIFLITAPYNDCSCGLGFYGLWAKRNQVQIANSEFEGAETLYDLEQTVNVCNLEDAKKFSGYHHLNMGCDGQIYQHGVKMIRHENIAQTDDIRFYTTPLE